MAQCGIVSRVKKDPLSRRMSYGDVIKNRRQSEPELKSKNIVEALGLERRLSMFSKPINSGEEADEIIAAARANLLESKRRVSSLKETRRKSRIGDDARRSRPLLDSPELRSPRRKSHSVDAQYMLESAIAANSQRLAAGLLRSGQVNINRLNEAGLGMVHYAAFEGRTECLELLLQHGAYVNLVDQSGVTALEIAVFEGHYDCASVLLQAGADDSLIRDGYYDRTISNPKAQQDAPSES